MSDELTRAAFEKALNTKFTLMDGERSVGSLELVQVVASKYPTLPGRDHLGRPFSLLFLGRHANHVPQGLYTFQTETMGEQQLFIVPLDRTEGGYLYEAVFN